MFFVFIVVWFCYVFALFGGGGGLIGLIFRVFGAYLGLGVRAPLSQHDIAVAWHCVPFRVWGFPKPYALSPKP